MKKRIFVIFALLLVATLLFASCDFNFGANDLQQLNDLLKLDYSKVQILVNVKSDAQEYNGKFTLTYSDATTIEYEIDKISTFEIGEDGSIATPSEDFITTKSGVVVIRDGEIVEGDLSELPTDLGVYVGGFTFKQAFFANVRNQNAKFEADVVDARNFTGNASLVCQDMHVVVFRNVNSNVLTSLELTYTADEGSQVKINYLFTK